MVYTQQNKHVINWIQNHQQANCKDIIVNGDIVVNKCDATFYSNLNIYDFNTIFPGKVWKWHVWTSWYSLIKRLIGKKYFMYFENRNIQRLNAFKYIFFKGIKIQKSILYLRYVF